MASRALHDRGGCGPDVAGADRLLALETKMGDVSRAVLLRMAKAYRRPLVSFYLDVPPVRGDRGEDFRTLPDRRTGGEPLVEALVRDIRSRQAVVRAVQVEEEEAEVVAAVRGGLLSLEEACSRYTLTVDEFLSWQFSIDQHGLAGLRTTRIQQYRQ